MPIIGEGNNVYIEYTIPENIRNLITDDFLKEFRNQLFRIHEHYSLDTFADFGIPMNTSTAGWYAAFGKACLLTNKEELFNYWRTLPWYDSDIFDCELAEMLVDNKLILEDSNKVLGELLNINPDDIVYCSYCGKLYTKDMVVEVESEYSDYHDEYYTEYKCLFCRDKENTSDSNTNATDYYRSVLKELNEYKEKHPIEEE